MRGEGTEPCCGPWGTSEARSGTILEKHIVLRSTLPSLEMNEVTKQRDNNNIL